MATQLHVKMSCLEIPIPLSVRDVAPPTLIIFILAPTPPPPLSNEILDPPLYTLYGNVYPKRHHTLSPTLHCAALPHNHS